MGIALIVGPGVLTLLLRSVDAYGYISTILCLLLNLLIVWFVFKYSQLILQFLNEGTAYGIGGILPDHGSLLHDDDSNRNLRVDEVACKQIGNCCSLDSNFFSRPKSWPL